MKRKKDVLANRDADAVKYAFRFMLRRRSEAGARGLTTVGVAECKRKEWSGGTGGVSANGKEIFELKKGSEQS